MDGPYPNYPPPGSTRAQAEMRTRTAALLNAAWARRVHAHRTNMTRVLDGVHAAERASGASLPQLMPVAALEMRRGELVGGVALLPMHEARATGAHRAKGVGEAIDITSAYSYMPRESRVAASILAAQSKLEPWQRELAVHQAAAFEPRVMSAAHCAAQA